METHVFTQIKVEGPPWKQSGWEYTSSQHPLPFRQALKQGPPQKSKGLQSKIAKSMAGVGCIPDALVQGDYFLTQNCSRTCPTQCSPASAFSNGGYCFAFSQYQAVSSLREGLCLMYLLCTRKHSSFSYSLIQHDILTVTSQQALLLTLGLQRCT